MGSGAINKRRYTKIQTDRVLLAIVARGVLSQRELRICAWVWSDSWGFNRSRTRPGVTASHIARAIDMDGGACRLVLGELIERGALIVHEDGSLEFCEHLDRWRQQHTQPDNHKTATNHACGIVTADPCGIVTPQNTQTVINRHGGRDKSSRKTCGIVTPLYRSAKQSKTKEQSRRATGESKKTRAPTAVELHYQEGFRKRYGHTPEIPKECAIKLATLVAKHGAELVLAKIDAWWDSPSGNWVKDARTIRPFLKCFDRIIVGPRGAAPGIDPERAAAYAELGL